MGSQPKLSRVRQPRGPVGRDQRKVDKVKLEALRREKSEMGFEVCVMAMEDIKRRASARRQDLGYFARVGKLV